MTAKRIKLHNHIMEMIEEQISYDLSRTFQGSGGRGSSENDIRRSRSGSAGGEDDPVSASALHGYFQFIDFVQLQEALALYEEKEHINSEELQAFVALCQFLIRLRLAIIANKWFDETLAVAGLEIPEGFSDSDDKEDDDHFDDQVIMIESVEIWSFHYIFVALDDFIGECRREHWLSRVIPAATGCPTYCYIPING